MRFRFDDTFDLGTTGFSRHARPLVWFHPAVRNVREFEFLTSCTIEGGPAIKAVMIGCGLGSEEVDYGHPNFFGDISFDLCDRFGVFLQAASRRFGRGRVLLFTDSTCFSNFCMYGPGKPELSAGFIDYLNRRDEKYPHARHWSFLLAVALVAVAVASGGGLATRLRIGTLALVAWPAFVLGITATCRLNARLYGPIEERTRLRTVVFEVGHADASFFDYMGISGSAGARHFEELYICAQRLGLHPCAGSVEDLERLRPAGFVIVNPVRRFGAEGVSKITRYVSAGGVLILLDSAGNGASTANEIIGPFALEVHAFPVRAEPAGGEHPGGEAANPGVADFYPALKVFGARAPDPAASSIPDLYVGGFGSGRIVICLNSYRYCQAVLGRPLDRTPPSAKAGAIFRELFAILAEVDGIGEDVVQY
jgi:hypothetical protein